jgi:hypothetical protein
MKTNKMNIKMYLFGIVICIVGFIPQANSQTKDTTIESRIFDVEKTFKPILSDAIKIPVNPNPEKPELKRPEFKYEVEAVKPVAVEPNIYTIKPLSLGTSLLPKLKNNYTRFGFGNYATPLFEFYINSVRNKKFQTGFFVKHLSSNGDENFNNFSNNTLYGYVKTFKAKQVYSLDAYYYRNRIQLYATPTSISDAENIGKVIYETMDIKGRASSAKKDSSGFAHQTELGYYRYQNNRSQNENDFVLKSILTKTFEEIPFELDAGFRINQYNNGNLTYNRRFLHLNPEIKIEEKEFYLRGGFNTMFIADSSKSSGHFFPKAEGGFAIIPSKMTVYAGINGNVQVNTLRSITSENIFVLNPGLDNTINKFEVYGGFKGQIGPMTGFNIQTSSSKIENNLFYGYNSSSFSQFTIFDEGKGSLTRLLVSVNHGFGEKFRINAAAILNNYTLSKISKASGRPELEVKTNLTYNMGDKFLFKLDLFYWGDRNVLVKGDNSLTEDKIKAFTDVNFGLEYRYKKHLSAFINFNNLTGNTYQRWYKYPVYGFNLLGGFNFTF